MSRGLGDVYKRQRHVLHHVSRHVPVKLHVHMPMLNVFMIQAMNIPESGNVKTRPVPQQPAVAPVEHVLSVALYVTPAIKKMPGERDVLLKHIPLHISRVADLVRYNHSLFSFNPHLQPNRATRLHGVGITSAAGVVAIQMPTVHIHIPNAEIQH